MFMVVYKIILQFVIECLHLIFFFPFQSDGRKCFTYSWCIGWARNQYYGRFSLNFSVGVFDTYELEFLDSLSPEMEFINTIFVPFFFFVPLDLFSLKK